MNTIIHIVALIIVPTANMVVRYLPETTNNTAMFAMHSSYTQHLVYYDVKRTPWSPQLQSDSDTLSTNAPLSIIIDDLGTVYRHKDEAEDDQLIIGVKAVGYIYFPADCAYRTLLLLRMSYTSLWNQFVLSLDEGNRLRSLLLARATAVQYPDACSCDLNNLLCSATDKDRVVLLTRCAYEAFTLTMLLRPPARSNQWCDASNALFANGVTFFSDTNVVRIVERHKSQITAEMRIMFPSSRTQGSLARDFIAQIIESQRLWSNEIAKTSAMDAEKRAHVVTPKQ